MLRSIGVRRCPSSFSLAQCMVVGGESKTVPFSGRIESCHPVATSFRHQGGMVRCRGKLGESCCSLEVTDVGRDAARFRIKVGPFAS